MGKTLLSFVSVAFFAASLWAGVTDDTVSKVVAAEKPAKNLAQKLKEKALKKFDKLTLKLAKLTTKLRAKWEKKKEKLSGAKKTRFRAKLNFLLNRHAMLVNEKINKIKKQSKAKIDKLLEKEKITEEQADEAKDDVKDAARDAIDENEKTVSGGV